MAQRRPAQGEELNESGTASEPRQAATVIVLRGGTAALEVLLVRRNPAQRFMGGAWVFPGGAVERSETAEGDAAHRLAGVRELEEEAGVTIADPGELVPWSRWITPAQIKIRFDTRFFLAPAPADATPRIDGDECVDWGWFTPAGALEAADRDEIELVFPTVKTLEGLRGFETAAAALEFAAGRTVEPVEPRVVVEGEVARILLPGEPGYE